MRAAAIRRRIVSAAMTGLVVTLCAAAVLPLLFILADLIHKGATSLDWNFFTHTPVPMGQTGGGVAHAIVGTGIIVGLACLIGLPIGIGAGVFLAEYGSGKLGWIVRFVADVMNGTPSIVIGIFAWTWLVRPVHHFSALAGGAALALGFPRWRTSVRVMVRTALTGIVTGALVGVARIAGETAPLLFTALGNLNFTTSIAQPMQTLSLQIFVYGTGPYEEWHRLAWAAALVLMGLVLVLAIAARWAVRRRYDAT